MIIENEIQIEASPETVWRITKDVESWPEWCPTMEAVTRLDDGIFRLGSVALIKQPGLRPAEWRVTAFAEEKSFTWETKILGISMAATHELNPSAADTKNILRLKVSGILAMLLWPLIRNSMAKSLERENSSLKATCESVSTDSQNSSG